MIKYIELVEQEREKRAKRRKLQDRKARRIFKHRQQGGKEWEEQKQTF